MAFRSAQRALLAVVQKTLKEGTSSTSSLQHVRAMGGGGGIIPDERGVRVGLKFALHGHYAPRHGPTPPHGPEYITYKGLTLRKAPENQTYSGKFLGFCMWFFWMYMFYNKFSERVYPGHSAHLDHDLAHEPSIYDPEDVDEDYYKEYARKWGIGAAAEGGAAAAAHGHH